MAQIQLIPKLSPCTLSRLIYTLSALSWPGPNEQAVELAGAGVFLRGVSLQIREMIFELCRACNSHSFDGRLHNNAAMEMSLDRSVGTVAIPARSAASARRRGVQKTLRAFNTNASSTWRFAARYLNAKIILFVSAHLSAQLRVQTV